jgi:hypothetical protein
LAVLVGDCLDSSRHQARVAYPARAQVALFAECSLSRQHVAADPGHIQWQRTLKAWRAATGKRKTFS